MTYFCTTALLQVPCSLLIHARQMESITLLELDRAGKLKPSTLK